MLKLRWCIFQIVVRIGNNIDEVIAQQAAI